MLHPKYVLLVGLSLLALPVASDAYYRGGAPVDDVSPWVVRSDLLPDNLRMIEQGSAAARIGDSFALFAPAANARDHEAARALLRAAKPRA
ncbi:hypothetical protein NP284_33060 [Rhodopseudomonas pseudopalustris]|uniref:Uncharacterized protein n=1 Tax=Rhodopseudomonas faecalis TaxID=99655 RepID=A0A318TJ18_9BRAD|nr:hypothetical protein [Rhodopseudomonas faecalis]PYF04861.1 hypothetical protein BJ122_10286 [Rhodopseudomonas faecalis]